MKKAMISILTTSVLLLFASCGNSGKTDNQSDNIQPLGITNTESSETTTAETTVTTEPSEIESETEPVKEEVQEESIDIFSELPETFYFTSGAGAWATYFNLNPDGTFVGNYHDTDPDIIYICDFEGRFTDVKEIDEYTYSMRLDYLDCEGTPGEEYYKNDIKFVYTEPNGFNDADEFMIYMPGSALSELPEESFLWAYWLYKNEYTVIPDDTYGIYNVNGKIGFIGQFD